LIEELTKAQILENCGGTKPNCVNTSTRASEYGDFSYNTEDGYFIESVEDGEYLRCSAGSKGFMACKDGLFPHISLVDRTKLFEDNPINVCYDAKGKDEKPCKNA